MTVKELIEKLKSMPQNLDVRFVWDGEDRSSVDEVIIGKTGEYDFMKPVVIAVLLLDKEDSLYNRKIREVKQE